MIGASIKPPGQYMSWPLAVARLTAHRTDAAAVVAVAVAKENQLPRVIHAWPDVMGRLGRFCVE
jgi:hypothetical protein